MSYWAKKAHLHDLVLIGGLLRCSQNCLMTAECRPITVFHVWFSIMVCYEEWRVALPFEPEWLSVSLRKICTRTPESLVSCMLTLWIQSCISFHEKKHSLVAADVLIVFYVLAK